MPTRRCDGCCLLVLNTFGEGLDEAWNVVSGSPQVVGGQLSLADGDSLYYEGGSLANPTADTGRRWTFLLTPDEDTTLQAWLMDGTDFQNGVVAWIRSLGPTPVVDQLNCDEVSLNLVLSGSPAVSIDVCDEAQPVLWLEPGKQHEVEVCWFPATYPEESIIRVKVRVAEDYGYGRQFVTQASVATTLEPDHFGLQLVSGPGQGVQIDNFRVWALEADCPQQCRADASSAGCAYEDHGITSSVVGNLITVIGVGVARCRVRHPHNSTDMIAELTVETLSTGGKPRAVVNCQCDGQRYKSVEIECTRMSGTTPICRLKLINHTPSGDQVIAQTTGEFTINLPFFLRACYDGRVLYGQASDTFEDTGLFEPTTAHEEGYWGGIGSGADSPHHVHVSRFTLSKHRDTTADARNCGECTGFGVSAVTCVPCVDVDEAGNPNAPQFLSVAISGFPSGQAGGCGHVTTEDCADLNGTYIAEWHFPSFFDCEWTFSNELVCDLVAMALRITFNDNGDGTYTLRAEVLFNVTAKICVYEKVYDSEPRCLEWDNEELEFVSQSFGSTGPGFGCDCTPLTIHISSIA
jgi:hypothetical protein